MFNLFQAYARLRKSFKIECALSTRISRLKPRLSSINLFYCHPKKRREIYCFTFIFSRNDHKYRRKKGYKKGRRISKEQWYSLLPNSRESDRQRERESVDGYRILAIFTTQKFVTIRITQ